MHKGKHPRGRTVASVIHIVFIAALVAGLSSAAPPVSAQAIDLRALREMSHVPSRDWESDIAAIERRYADFDTGGGAIVFIGSSSINRWNTLAADFPGQPVINAGFGGSHIVDSIVYTDRLITPFAPHTVVLFAGSNDISSGKTPVRVLDDYVAFVQGVHRALPTTQIVFISITPSESRWSQHPRVMEANALIKAHTETDRRLHFVDIYDAMLGPDGLPNAKLYVEDRLHLSRAGYEVWIDALQPYFSYPFQPVSLTGPAHDGAVTTPVEIRAAASPDLAPTYVRVTLDEHVLYEGTDAPDGALSTGHLSDGRYDVMLHVTDGQGEHWQRRLRLFIANAGITEPAYGAIVRDDVTIGLTSGFAAHELRHATVTLTPYHQGMLQQPDTITLYDGDQLPASISLDTLQLDDTTYEIRLNISAVDGLHAQHSQPLIVRNWQLLHDEFLPPQTNVWFGALERKKTMYESPGWDYATDNATTFFGDDSRRVWLGTGPGVLQWEAPLFHRITATLFTAAGHGPSVRITVSADGEMWLPVTSETTVIDSNQGDWHKMELHGQMEAAAAARYVRLTVGEDDTADVLQLGQVTIVSRSSR